MDGVPNFASSRFSVEVERMLTRPAPDFAGLVNAANSDLVLYTHDLNRHLTYMSDSSRRVCGLDFPKWERRSFVPMFTDHPWNDYIIHFDERTMKHNEVQLIRCEIFSEDGERIQMETRRFQLTLQGEPIGIIGLAKRIFVPEIHQPSVAAPHLRPMHNFSLTNLLTIDERRVVQAVVDGEMNKNIAKRLGVAIRTVEARRARAMCKLETKSLSELVRFWIAFQDHQCSATTNSDVATLIT